ncbi:MAG TPA: hypothetical protein VGR89_03670 [Puia sp.]|nr:hypothetical protein [Puia sp.]
MLQNRVDPRGSLIKTTARGAWMGNRGVIHDGQRNIIRPWKLKAWLTCQLVFKDRHRQVMAPDRYTELFFLDEATAFSAGHRPCAECRRSAFNRFKMAWIVANQPWLYLDGRLHQWSPFGYEEVVSPPQSGGVEVLTPKSVVAAFRAGYKPQVAPVAGSQLR